MTYLRVADVRLRLEALLSSRSNSDTPGSLPFLDKFMMPYDKNEQFIVCGDLLQKLNNTLCEVVPKQHNHRVALYGMGGIGKTQTAIAYVYAFRASYERIYWISAANEALLLSGFQDIAKRSGCISSTKDMDPREISDSVLGWLRQQINWLLVIDNLDHVELIEGFLPERSPNQHTLITTRNPNANGIPARGLEIPFPNNDECIEMLYTLGGIDLNYERDIAEKVVKELGYLPLGIGQAASYVREVTRSFEIFLDHYQRFRKQLHDWVPGGIRQYPSSIARTWSISFEYINHRHPQTAKLFQNLSFLNPDLILLEFLKLGKAALDDDLVDLISNEIEFAKALRTLENFSLITWSRDVKALSIHRLV